MELVLKFAKSLLSGVTVFIVFSTILSYNFWNVLQDKELHDRVDSQGYYS